MAPNPDITQLGLLLIGRVQGVGFRWWTVRTARSLGLHGTVRNRADGTVEVHASGPSGAIERFRRQLLKGPTGARVDEAVALPSVGDLPDDFRVFF